ncbi:MAG: DUF1858 domain-containing protein [Nitrospinae bacterium]|nr:DUF1858 domain-containing protein [Nitrospinota bacterium]
MEKFPRSFIIAAISYLLVGVAVGIATSAGELDPFAGRFVHAHLNLVGFLGMFIYGVAYHILPRFNATPIKHPALVGVHFYAVNAGLVGMVLSALADGVYGAGGAHHAFVASGVLEAVGIVLFAYNIIPVLVEGGWQTVQPAPKPAFKPAAAPPPPPAPSETREQAISPDMRIAEILEKWPALTDVLVNSGFKTLAIPAARASFAKSTTIEQASRIHRVDAAALVRKLNAALNGGNGSHGETPKQEKVETKAASTMAKGRTIARGEEPVSDTLVGSLLEAYPETKAVFEKHYGAGCFSCPGQAFETIAQTAGMHGIKSETILGEIITSIQEAKA